MKKFPKWLIVVSIFAVCAIALFSCYKNTYNSLVYMEENVSGQWAEVQNQYQRRMDLIPNLVEVVKGEKEYEKEVLENLTKLRSEATKEQGLQEKAKLNNEYNKILLLAENYPNLKSNASFLNLQKQLTKMENQLQAARRIYNVEVTEYNTKIVTVPTNIIAGLFGFKQVEYFEVKV